MNPNLCLCFWGMHADTVKAELERIGGQASLVDQECVETWFRESQELGPIEGQHSFHALLELNKTYPNKSLWQTADTSVILCSGSPEDIDMVHAIGQQSNFKGTKFLKPELADLVNALHLSYMHVLQVSPNNEVPPEVLASIKQRWSQYNGILSTSVCQYWILAHHTGEIWTKISKILEGNVVKLKGRDFQVPAPLHSNGGHSRLRFGGSAGKCLQWNMDFAGLFEPVHHVQGHDAAARHDHRKLAVSRMHFPRQGGGLGRRQSQVPQAYRRVRGHLRPDNVDDGQTHESSA